MQNPEHNTSLQKSSATPSAVSAPSSGNKLIDDKLNSVSNALTVVEDTVVKPATKHAIRCLALTLVETTDPEEMVMNKMPLLQLEKNLSIKDIWQSGTHISVLKKTSEEFTLMCMVVMIQNFCSSFNVGKNMNAFQIQSAAVLLTEKYYRESLEDFMLMFRKAKLGEYGKIYDCIDINVIGTFMEQYLDQKSQYIEFSLKQNKKEEVSKTAMTLSEWLDKNPEAKADYYNMFRGVKSADEQKEAYESYKRDVLQKGLKGISAPTHRDDFMCD